MCPPAPRATVAVFATDRRFRRCAMRTLDPFPDNALLTAATLAWSCTSWATATRAAPAFARATDTGAATEARDAVAATAASQRVVFTCSPTCPSRQSDPRD